MRPEKIRERRRALGWTQEVLAERAGVSQSIVSTVEGGGKVAEKSRERIIAALSATQLPPAKPRPKEPEPKAPPANAPPGAGDPAGMGTLSTHTSDVLEFALTRVIKHDRHLIRDANAVLAAYGDTSLPQIDQSELEALATRWLDAAAELRREGALVDAQSLSARVSLRALRAH